MLPIEIYPVLIWFSPVKEFIMILNFLPLNFYHLDAFLDQFFACFQVYILLVGIPISYFLFIYKLYRRRQSRQIDDSDDTDEWSSVVIMEKRTVHQTSVLEELL